MERAGAAVVAASSCREGDGDSTLLQNIGRLIRLLLHTAIARRFIGASLKRANYGMEQSCAAWLEAASGWIGAPPYHCKLRLNGKILSKECELSNALCSLAKSAEAAKSND